MYGVGRTMLHSTCSSKTGLWRALYLVVAIAAVLVPCTWAAEPAPATLTSIRAIHQLTRAQAGGGVPVAFEGTVTYYNPSDVDLFVQDGSEAIYVQTQQNEDLTPGDRIPVRGRTRASFTADVVGDRITVLHHGEPPKPVTADFGQLIRAERDCMFVSVRATVRSADTMYFGTTRETYLRLLMSDGFIDATVVGSDPNMLKNLLDAEVEVTGAVSGKFDSKMQLIGIVLEVPTLANVKIQKPARTRADSLPITPMDQILSSYSIQDQSRRVRVRGTITYYQPGSAVVLQDGAKSLWISTRVSDPMQIGDIAEASGFPSAREGYLSLDDGEVQDTHILQPVTPEPSVWRNLADWNSGNAAGHQNDLVSIEGEVKASVREESQDEYELQSDGRLFSAIYRHPPNNKLLPPKKDIATGTIIRVTGICMVVQGSNIDPSVQEVPFNILLRSFDDISIVAKPPVLNVPNLTILVSVLAVLLLVGGIRGWIWERKVRYQNAAVAYSERRRSRILEDINGSRPLAEIIEQITELVSFKLKGAPCWCQIIDGARLGSYPKDLVPFRVLSEAIPGRMGSSLGTMNAAFDSRAKVRPLESETLSSAVGLAALAIETRRLYSDLVHRSEFDLLTDIHNRFSLENHLDQQIELARQDAGIFGLIYVDLDKFKQVNDLYGHLVGDLYLREVALRMQRQLRPNDLLARLGGDEFAVLLPKIRNRAEIEEVAHRLQRCLVDPFATGGYFIQGSASVGIALYPEDGATKDNLLNAADAAMYMDKSTRGEVSTSRSELQ